MPGCQTSLAPWHHIRQGARHPPHTPSLRPCSQTSEEDLFATPSKPKRKKYTRKPKYNFRKGHTHAVKHTYTGKEPIKVVRPSTYLYRDVRFQQEKNTFDVKLSSDGRDYQKELRPASGNQIMNLFILAQVFLQLICPDKSCRGRMHLYEQLMQDGLQKFLLVKCGICHRIAAEFPASLPIRCSAEECINNKSLRVRGQSELNVRSLLAVHSTPQSWEDFRLTCSLLDLEVPTAAMSKVHMKRFVESTTSVVARSMKGSGEMAHSSLPLETLHGTGEAISLTKAWLRQLIQSLERYWTTSSMTGSAISARTGMKKEGPATQESSQNFGTVACQNCYRGGIATSIMGTMDIHKRWQNCYPPF